jgi:hypothetical protein
VMICGYGKRIDWTEDKNYRGFRWRALPSMLEVGPMSGGSTPVRCMGISNDQKIGGTAQYGSSNPGSGSRQAFLWSSAGGGTFTICNPIVGPPSTSNEGVGNAISRNGVYVVGRSWVDANGNWQAFRSSGGANTIGIPYLPGDTYSEAYAVSGDGLRVGGYSWSDSTGYTAFIWDYTNGARNVKDMLTAAGIDMTGWTLTEVHAVSGDGTTIAGVGTYDGGSGPATRGWVVSGLPLPPPEPPSIQPVLNEGATTVTVTIVSPLATAVTLYRNHADVVATVDPAGATSVAITVPPLVANDYYTATQTTPNGTSPQTTMGRCVQPTTMHFSDDFEAATLKDWWLTRALDLSTEQVHSGAQSLKEPATGGENRADVTPTNPDNPGVLQYRYPVLFEFWMYETGTGAAKHSAAAYQYNNGYWAPGLNPYYLFEIGNISDITKATYDPTKYQGRGAIVGSSKDTYEFNLADLAPARSPGWHKFSIKIGSNRSAWYVDGKRGMKQPNLSPRNIVAIRVGSATGSPDGNPAYYDDVYAVRFTEHDPVLTLTNVNVAEGTAIPATAEVASDADTPDTVTLSVASTVPSPLPSWLVVSAASVVAGGTATTGPTATITISGTPPAGSAGTYTLNLSAVDDFNHTVTGAVTVTVCAAPTVASIAPPNGTQGQALTGVAIAGTSFAAGASVRLTRSGQADVVATNVAVSDSSHLTCDLDLTGAAVGTWNVVVTTCVAGTLTDGFEVKSACHTPPEDVDGDGDVDLADFSIFQSCFNGPNRPYALPPGFDSNCKCLDVEPAPSGDGDLDLADFGKFQGCFNGPNRPPSAGCGS